MITCGVADLGYVVKLAQPNTEGSIEMAVRAKFRCDGKTEANMFQFRAVTDDGTPENERYHKYTPYGDLKMTVDNPPASEQFEVGKSYYLDFTPAE